MSDQDARAPDAAVMRRVRSVSGPEKSNSAQNAPLASATISSVGVWYVAIIATLLLVAAGMYIIYLHQERLQWQDAANQTSIGQEFLRADRDEILQKVQVRDTELSNLERELSEREAEISTLESERDELKSEVAGLVQDLADGGQEFREDASADDEPVNFLTAEQENKPGEQDDLETGTAFSKTDEEIERLETALAETGELLVQYQSDLREQERLATEARLEKTALQKEVTRLRKDISETELAFRRSQIIRGHHASLGDVKPYLADVGPEYWQAIEERLKDKLQREMAIPDLSDIGWSYEGARLLVTVGGPSMVMLLYADPEGSPISLTIAQDLSGVQPSTSRQQAGLNLIEWRDHSHAFVLAGEVNDVVLQVIASALLEQMSKVTQDSAVPSGRFFRPESRPKLSERQSSG